LKNARLIYISGGDQSKFMRVVADTEIHDAIHEAFQNGSTIAGTSAGAAVMSKKMITGNEFKHPEYTGEFRTIEADNMELKEGLGLLPNAIIDQHFIWRMRMNRLITVAIENPEETCIGIDESTAILVKGNQAEVVGKYQVIVLKNNGGRTVQDGLLGAENMRLGVYLPGQTFAIE
jgi:cyanophycinase